MDDPGVCWGGAGAITFVSSDARPESAPEVETDGQQQGRSKLSHRPYVTGRHTAPPLNT